MKKSILLMSLFASYSVAFCQSVGGKIGMNSASISGSTLTTSKIGFHVGMWLEFKPSEKVGVMPELVYSAQGSSVSGSSQKINLNYINLPVMVNYYVTENIFLQAGPQLGFLLSANSETTGGNVDIKQYLTSTDISLCFGIGGQWEGFLANFRYNLGLNDGISDPTFKSNVGLTGSVTNSVIQFTVGYKFK